MDTQEPSRAMPWIDPLAKLPLVPQDDSEAFDRPSDRFKFISGLDTSYTKSTRAHVLKNHVSRKRKRRTPPCLHSATSTSRPARGNQDAIANRSAARHLPDQASFAQHPRLQLGQLVGTGVCDPFSAFARPLSASEWRFADYYTNESMKQYGLSRSTRFYPPRDICFPVIIRDEAAIEAMIAYAAISIGNSTSTTLLEASSSRAKSIRQVNERLSDPQQRFSNPTISAIIGLIAHLKELKSEAVSVEEQYEIHAHWQGLRQIIIARGGFRAIAEDVEMSWIVHWVDIVSLGELSAGLTPLLPRHGCLDNQGCEAVTLSAYVEAFIVAYNDFRNASLHRILAWKAPFESQPHVHQLFRTGTSIWRLLTDPTSSCVISKTTVLFYLNILLWSHGARSPVVIANFFKGVRHAMTDQDLDITGKVDVLFWILITNPNDHRFPDDPSKLHLLARLLYVEKHLSRALRAELEAALLQFLSAGDPVDLQRTPDPLRFRVNVTQDWALRTGHTSSPHPWNIPSMSLTTTTDLL